MGIDIAELAARAAIEDALLTYCRGVDRLDADLVRAAFHDDAVLLDYGPEPLHIDAFVTHVIPRLGERFTATQHRVSNTRIERTGSTAKVEAYVLAFHVESGDDGRFLHTFNGRYIDTAEDRGQGWRIAQRILRVDWSRRDPWHEDMSGSWPQSGRDRSDPVYQ